MSATDFINKPLASFLPYRMTQGTFGVEIECEGLNLPEAIPGWESHKENSLRGEAREYVTRGAVTMEGLAKCMGYMNKYFNKCETKVNEQAHRASSHIHVNMQMRTPTDVVGSLIVFALIEPVWMRLCGPNRDGNLFCIPSYDCGDLQIYLARLLADWDEGGLPTFRRERGKYAALNLNPLRNFGSIEFRTFPCSVQKDQILEWAGWCERVVLAAEKCPDKSFRSLINDAHNNPIAFCGQFFGDRRNEISMFETYQAIQIGAETAYECVRVWNRWLDTHNKKAA